jgi:hypothetical protein|eukprot:COSAG01_NODE_2891_length_6906_cov_10.367563_1_plen_402_part_00
MGMGMGGMGMGGMGMGGMGMRGGMGMGGMGMRGGMQGMQGMQQGQQMMPQPPPEDDEPEIREKEVQAALEFVDKPEVKLTGEENEEEKEKKLKQITQYLEKNLGLTEEELNTVLVRSGIDPHACDSSDDFTSSSEEEEEDAEEAMDYLAQQNHDMRGSVPMPLLLSAVALLVSAPNHRAWWDWVMGDPLPVVGRPLQQQLGYRGGVQRAPVPPAVVVINQPRGGGVVGAGGLAGAARRGRGRWRRLLLLLAIVVLGRAWLIRHWASSGRPLVRRLIAAAAGQLGLTVKPIVPPDPDALLDQDEGLRTEVTQLRSQLRSLRSSLYWNKSQAHMLTNKMMAASSLSARGAHEPPGLQERASATAVPTAVPTHPAAISPRTPAAAAAAAALPAAAARPTPQTSE